MTGAPGRTRTSTMLPLPDFESGASTNSATGAGGRDHSCDERGVNGPASAERAPAKRAPSSAMRHKLTRACEPGPRATRLSRALPLSAITDPFVWPLGPGSRWARPGHERTSHLQPRTRARHTLPRHASHHRVRAR